MSIEDSFLGRLPAALRDRVRRGVPLRDLTTLRVGGPAALVCPADNPEQALRFHAAARESGLPLFALGGGSNVLADDRGYDGVLLHLTGRGCELRGDTVTVGAGLGMDDLVARTLSLGLTGLEFASGLPGTVGGALAGNAGCYGHEIGELVCEAAILSPAGEILRVEPGSLGFRYRGTALRDDGAILLEATLRLRRGDVGRAAAEREAHLADRRTKHPVTEPSAGSWFRNLEPHEPGGRRRAAGELLDQGGAKAMREGDAAVYAKHANIIVNLGRAGSGDVLRLADRMQAAVRDRFGVELQPEVRSLGPGAAPRTG